MSQKINLDRRRFFGAAAGTLAAAQLFLAGAAGAQSGNAKSAAARSSRGRIRRFPC